MASISGRIPAPDEQNHNDCVLGKRKWDVLERYERHFLTTSSPSLEALRSKKPKTVLEQYLSTTPATCVKVIFQSDSEESESDEESIPVRPCFSDNDEQEGEVGSTKPAAAAAATAAAAVSDVMPAPVISNPIIAHAPVAVMNATRKGADIVASGQEDDPIVLSDSDDDDDNASSDVEDEIKKTSAIAGSPSPTAQLVTPSGNHHHHASKPSGAASSPSSSSSPSKGRFVSSESSCASSAMSSVMDSPDGAKLPKGVRGGRTPRRAAARRILYREDDDEDDFFAFHSSPEHNDSDSGFDIQDSDEESSVNSEQVADEFYCSAPPKDPYSMFSLQDFKNLWRLCEKNLGEKTEDIEGGRLIRQANTKLFSGDSTAQFKAQYGRILPDATHKLLTEILRVEKDDVFVDVGHGIGNAVLQAAYTVGCESRGIEVVGDRNFIALRFKHELDELLRIRRVVFDDMRGSLVGEVHLKHGRLELPDSREFITNPGRRTKAFVNNFDGVFAERSSKPGQKYHLDHFIAGLFAVMEPGSIMVTLHPLTLGHSLESANDLRSRHGLEKSDLASFFKVETVTLGEAKDVVSWSQGGSNRKPIQVWVYTRLEQPSTENAVFLCNNPKCEKAQDSEPQAAVTVVDADGEGDRLVIGECDCGMAARPLRTRRRVDYNTNLEYVHWPY